MIHHAKALKSITIMKYVTLILFIRLGEIGIVGMVTKKEKTRI